MLSQLIKDALQQLKVKTKVKSPSSESSPLSPTNDDGGSTPIVIRKQRQRLRTIHGGKNNPVMFRYGTPDKTSSVKPARKRHFTINLANHLENENERHKYDADLRSWQKRYRYDKMGFKDIINLERTRLSTVHRFSPRTIINAIHVDNRIGGK